MEEKEKRICQECGGTLRAVGNSRKNGKNHDDWKSREYHKKCWKEIQSEREFHQKWMKLEESE